MTIVMSTIVPTEILHASCGPIRGNSYVHGDKVVDGYLGIPYAKPPVGKLRFKKPEPADRWEDVRDCSKHGPVCPQTDLMEELNINKEQIDEASGLVLNVFVRRCDSKEFPNGRPVIFYIHGSGYEISSSRDRNDQSLTGKLPLKDIVFVSINYRLGFFGFLTTGDDNCRGNMGLWDLTLGLKWVQKHIRSFGGNPDNVTLLGFSAGASSADLLSYSPHSRDLFHKYASCSGAGMCDFAIRTSEDQSIISKEFAIHNGYTGNDSASLFAWFKSQPVEVLSKLKTFKKSISGFLNFAPNLDGDFFPKPLDELKKEAPRKPAIFSIGEYEGLMLYPVVENAVKELRKRIELYYGDDIVGADKKEDIHQRLYEFYLNGVAEDDETEKMKRLVEFVGDSLFSLGSLVSAQSSAKHGNDTYLYVFEYFNSKAYGAFEKFLPFKAATHGTESSYIVGEISLISFELSDEDREMINKMTTMYANFAKTGNPGFQKYSLEHPQSHYAINYPESKIRDVYQGGRCTSELWKEILEINKSYQKVFYGKQ